MKNLKNRLRTSLSPLLRRFATRRTLQKYPSNLLSFIGRMSETLYNNITVQVEQQVRDDGYR